MIVDQRRRTADLLSGLTSEQFRQPSLCAGWTVHDVAAHLVTFLRFGQAKLYWGILTTAADLDRINRRLTQRESRRTSSELVERLRRSADSRMSIPRSGYDPVLTDLVLHDLDIRLPLGLPRGAPQAGLRVALDHLTTKPALGFTMGSRLDGLRLLATDTGWTYGAGAPVRGTAESLLLGVSGRTIAFDDLDGDGVPTLRRRVLSPPATGPGRRLLSVVDVLVNPPPRERRSRRAEGGD
jgi:uncharacterized protein (TIGR03083 family)